MTLLCHQLKLPTSGSQQLNLFKAETSVVEQLHLCKKMEKETGENVVFNRHCGYIQRKS